ncbi:MAG: diguanylate cyclase, partial [Pseudomonadota bacterium]
MQVSGSEHVKRLRAQAAQVLNGPHMLAFIPAVMLLAYWLGGDMALTLMAVGFPLAWLAFGGVEDLVRRQAARDVQPG